MKVAASIQAATLLSLVNIFQSLALRPICSTSSFSQRISCRLSMTEPSTKASEVLTTVPATRVRRTLKRQQRKNSLKWKKKKVPAVDSTLLRFVRKEKESLASGASLEDDMGSSSLSSNNSSRASALHDIEASSSSAYWGQYNSHRVESVLLNLANDLNTTTVATVGARVETQALARVAKRRIRAFLKQRDNAWSDPADAPIQNNGSVNSGNATVSAVVAEAYQYRFEDVVDVMLEFNLTSKDIVEVLMHSPGLALMRPRNSGEGAALETTLRSVFQLLCVTLQLRRYDARKVIRSCPGLLTLRGSQAATQVVAMLSQLDVSPSSLARDKSALPIMLSRSPADLFRLISFLASDAIRMPTKSIGPLLRRQQCQVLLDAVAPVRRSRPGDLLLNSEDDDDDDEVENADNEMLASLWRPASVNLQERVDETFARMSETAWLLRHEIGTADLGKVISAYPAVLLLDVKSEILPVAKFLMNDLGIWQDDLPGVLQLYPTLLGMPVEKMQSVSNYLLALGVAPDSLPGIFRSFPSLLTLDIETEMIPVVRFLRSIGVVNVGRFITRLPPILGYSVSEEIVPKWEFLNAVYADPRFELSKFPSYFSYPLDRVVQTRFAYLTYVKKMSAQMLSLDRVLSYGDRDFAVKVVGDHDDGKAFAAFSNQFRKARHEQAASNNRNRETQASKRKRSLKSKSNNTLRQSSTLPSIESTPLNNRP